jgi:protein SCO1/2
MTRFAALISAATVVVGLVLAAIYVWMAPPPQCSLASNSVSEAVIGGPFTLVNHLGQTVTDKDVTTGPMLVYFGFTFCPDVCPLDTARNAQVVDVLSQNGIDVTPVFITIDPERDTPAVLADYVAALHPAMVGLTGTSAQINAAAKSYRVYYQKNGSGDDYLVDHTTFSYLMGPDGLWEFFRREATVEEMVKTITCFVEHT